MNAYFHPPPPSVGAHGIVCGKYVVLLPLYIYYYGSGVFGIANSATPLFSKIWAWWSDILKVKNM